MKLSYTFETYNDFLLTPCFETIPYDLTSNGRLRGTKLLGAMIMKEVRPISYIGNRK